MVPTNSPSTETLIAKMDSMREKLNEVSDKLDKDYVRMDIFNLRTGRLESMVYGITGVVGATLVAAIVNFFVKK